MAYIKKPQQNFMSHPGQGPGGQLCALVRTMKLSISQLCQAALKQRHSLLFAQVGEGLKNKGNNSVTSVAFASGMRPDVRPHKDAVSFMTGY